jgi:hypothetical protein
VFLFLRTSYFRWRGGHHIIHDIDIELFLLLRKIAVRFSSILDIDRLVSFILTCTDGFLNGPETVHKAVSAVKIEPTSEYNINSKEDGMDERVAFC